MAAPVRIVSPRTPTPAPAASPSLDALMEQFLEGVSARNGGQPPPLRDWVELAEAWRIARALDFASARGQSASPLTGARRVAQ